MKNLIVVIVCASLLSACGSPKSIDGKTYGTYGLFNQGDMKNDKIHYKLITGNVVWSILLCETFVAPLYFIGFSLYEPVGRMDGTREKGEL